MKPRSSATQADSAVAESRPTPQELWKRYHRRTDPNAENALVEQYLPLVRTVVARLAMTLPEHVDQDDLNSAGLVGLLQALRNYDPSCGTSFETYARVRIRGAMLDELRRMDWVPRTIHEKARRIQEVMNQLEQRLGRTPTEEQMAKALDISVSEYNDLLTEIRPAAFVCLDSTASSEGNDSGNLYEVVANPNEDSPTEEVSRRELKEVVLQRLKHLPEIQRKVLALYYHEDLHLREIAEVFGLTESRICQIHSQAILSIRAYIQRYEAGVAGNVAPSETVMIILIGMFVVTASIIGGFLWGGGSLHALWHPNELVVIGGGALGGLIIMSPKKVLVDMAKGVMTCFKGAPYNRAAYEELLKVLYELFLLGRRNGMIALEEHVTDPKNSSILKKYPLFSANHHAVEFLCGSLRPIIDGKIKPDQLRMLLDVEIGRLEIEHHAPVSVLTKTADAMPGFGIVAAVLGIIITMASISGAVEVIGEKVASALVGTFLGILLSYGYMNPLATNLEFVGEAELDFTKCISACVVGFANGMAPVTAVEIGRRGLSSELRPSAEELEQMLKSLKAPAKG